MVDFNRNCFQDEKHLQNHLLKLFKYFNHQIFWICITLYNINMYSIVKGAVKIAIVQGLKLHCDVINMRCNVVNNL